MACHKIFEALGDPTRLALVERLAANGSMPTLELVTGLGMSRQAATKHLTILENAGIVASTTKGRQVVRKLQPESLSEAKTWMDQHAEMWSQKLNALANYLDS